MGFIKGKTRNTPNSSGTGRFTSKPKQTKILISHELWKNKSDISQTKIEKLEEFSKRLSNIKIEIRDAKEEQQNVTEDFQSEKENLESRFEDEKEIFEEELENFDIEANRELKRLNEEKQANLLNLNKLNNDFKMALENHNKKYDKLLSQHSQVYKICNDIIKEFEIKGSYTGNKITQEEVLSYSITDIFEMLKYYADEINNLEDSLDDDDKLKSYIKSASERIENLPETKRVSLSLCLTPVSIVSSVISIFAKTSLQQKIQPFLDALHQEVLYCKAILEKQRPIIEQRKIDKAPSEEKHRNRIKDLEKEINTNFNVREVNIRESIKKKKDALSVNNPELSYNEESSELQNRYKAELEEVTKSTREKLQELEQSLSNLKAEYKDFISENLTIPSLMNNRQEEFSKKKIELSKKIEEFQEHKDLSIMDFTLELPPNEIFTNYWKQYLELDKELYQRKLHLDNLMKEYEEKGITEQSFIDEYNKLHTEETELFLVNTSNLILGHYDTDKYLKDLKDLINSDDGEPQNPKALFSSDFKNKTILCVYKKNEERDILINLIKRIVLSILSTYHSDSCVVNIINPENKPYFDDIQINRDVINNLTKEVRKGQKYVQSFNTEKECNELFEEIHNTDLKLRSSELIAKSYEEYVQDKRSTGGKPNKYNVNIIVEPDKKTSFSEFFDVQRGVINIVISDEDKYISKSFENESDIIKRVVDYGTYKYCDDSFNTIIEVDDVEKCTLFISEKDEEIKRIYFNPISYQEIEELKEFLRNRALNVKPDPLTVPDFINRVVGNTDNYFKGDVEKGLLLYIGYQNGDRLNYRPVFLDEDAKPHMLICGTTGGGKSVTFGVMNNVMKVMYSPEDLEVVYIDLKIVEVGLHAVPNKYPQASVLCGTTSEEYLMSVTRYVEQEMDYRYNQLFTKYGVNKLSSIREKQRAEKELLKETYEKALEHGDMKLYEEYKKKHDDFKITKRMVFLIDEVAQAWGGVLSDENKTLFSQINLKLFQLARAAGIHIIYVTQDIAKLPSQIVDLLQVRGCTVAPKTISQNALRNDFASRPENQFVGFFAVNDMGGAEQGNRQYVVPFSPESYTKLLTKKVNALCKQRGIETQNAVTFSDSDPYDERLFDRYLSENKDKLTGYDIFLGEEARFMKEFKPCTLTLSRDNKQGITIFSTSSAEKIAIAKTMFKSLKDKAYVFPVYCKRFYDDLPQEFFYDGLRKEKDIQYYACGRNMLNPNKVTEVENLAAQGLFDQVFKDDIFTAENQANLNGSSSLEAFLQYELENQKRRLDAGNEVIPKYIFIFDFDQHDFVLENSYYAYKTFGQLSRSLSSSGIYLVFFTSIIDKYYDNELSGYYIGSHINGILNLPKDFKRPTSMVRLKDTTDAQSTVFKLPREVAVEA